MADVQSVIGVGPLDNVIYLLQQFGFFRVVLPFLLVFAIMYAVLVKTKVLGDPATSAIAKNASAIIAFVAAFFFIAYTPVVDALAVLIPQASFLLVVALLVLMMIAFVWPGYGTAAPNPWVWGIFLLVIVGIFVAIVGASVGENIPILGGLAKALAGEVELTQEQVSFLVGLIIIIGIPLLIVWMLTRPQRPQGPQPPQPGWPWAPGGGEGQGRG